MKIIQVINSLRYRGGAQVFLYDLVNELKKCGHEVLVIALYGNIDPSFNDLNVKTMNKRKKIDFKASRRLKKTILNFEPDVVHFHLSCLPSYFHGFGYKKQKFILMETMHSIPNTTMNFYSRYLRKQFIKKDLLTLVAITKTLGEFATNLYKKEITYINNGFKRITSLNEVEKKYDLIIVANMDSNKNHILLFQAINELKNDNLSLTLLCIGGGELLEKNKELIDKMGLSKQVFFMGPVVDVYTYLIKSKIFVLSSLREGNPISVLEAMGAGLPVIVPNIGGLPDIVEDNVNGLLYSVNDIDELKKSIMILMNDNKKRKEIGNHNFIYSAQFDIKNTTKEYIYLYNKLIKEENNE